MTRGVTKGPPGLAVSLVVHEQAALARRFSLRRALTLGRWKRGWRFAATVAAAAGLVMPSLAGMERPSPVEVAIPETLLPALAAPTCKAGWTGATSWTPAWVERVGPASWVWPIAGACEITS